MAIAVSIFILFFCFFLFQVPYHCSVMTTEEQRLKSATDAINELNVTQSSPLLQCSRNKNKRPRVVDDACRS